MATMNIEILNPKAEKLLEDLEDLDLIKIRKAGEDLVRLAEEIRSEVDDPPTMDEIVAEVKKVRAERYAAKQAKGNH